MYTQKVTASTAKKSNKGEITVIAIILAVLWCRSFTGI